MASVRKSAAETFRMSLNPTPHFSATTTTDEHLAAHPTTSVSALTASASNVCHLPHQQDHHQQPPITTTLTPLVFACISIVLIIVYVTLETLFKKKGHHHHPHKDRSSMTTTTAVVATAILLFVPAIVHFLQLKGVSLDATIKLVSVIIAIMLTHVLCGDSSSSSVLLLNNIVSAIVFVVLLGMVTTSVVKNMGAIVGMVLLVIAISASLTYAAAMTTHHPSRPPTVDSDDEDAPTSSIKWVCVGITIAFLIYYCVMLFFASLSKSSLAIANVAVPASVIVMVCGMTLYTATAF
jgi:hypothetical protein